jgi:hypothetical protein
MGIHVNLNPLWGTLKKKNPKRYDYLEYEVNIGLHVLMEPPTLFREHILTLSELVSYVVLETTNQALLDKVLFLNLETWAFDFTRHLTNIFQFVTLHFSFLETSPQRSLHFIYCMK